MKPNNHERGRTPHVERHYRIQEVMAVTGLSRSAIFDALSRGKLSRSKFGRSTRIAESALLAWLEAAKRDGALN